jgi:hypothetical protein
MAKITNKDLQVFAAKAVAKFSSDDGPTVPCCPCHLYLIHLTLVLWVQVKQWETSTLADNS